MRRSIRPRARMAGFPSPTFCRLTTLIAIAILFAACAPAPSPSASSPRASRAAAVTQAEPPRVATDAALGHLVDGLPETWNGETVLRGAAIRTAIAASTDDRAFLVTGWFHAWKATRFCTVNPDPITGICFSFALFAGRVASEPLLIARGAPEASHGIDIGGAEHPVLLRIHTHDARCPATDASCPARPVLLELLWLGDEPTGSPPPRPLGERPPDGLSQADAIDRAKAAAQTHNGPLTVVSVRATQIWVVYPDREPYSADQWVWEVTLSGNFAIDCGEACVRPATTERVVIDYLTGAFIEGDL